MSWQVKKEVLFERSLPEARWNCSKYAPEVPEKKPKLDWKIKAC